MTVPVAHDFICPWCWIGFLQALRLKEEFAVEIDWRGYELFPAELEWPNSAPTKQDPENKPKTLSRLQFLEHADGIVVPKTERPKKMRTHNAHLAIEHAKSEGVADQLVEALYRALWERGETINEVETLVGIAEPILPKGSDLRGAIAGEVGAANIVHFDDDAYAGGVYNVPTFFIDGERLAEMPYGLLRAAMERARTVA